MQNSSLGFLHNDICSFDKLLMGSWTGDLLEQPSLGVNGKGEAVMFIVQKKLPSVNILCKECPNVIEFHIVIGYQ